MNIIDSSRDADKERSRLVNNFFIDSRYLQEIIPQLFNKDNNLKPEEFNGACDSAIRICEDLEVSAAQLKTMISSNRK